MTNYNSTHTTMKYTSLVLVVLLCVGATYAIIGQPGGGPNSCYDTWTVGSMRDVAICEFPPRNGKRATGPMIQPGDDLVFNGTHFVAESNKVTICHDPLGAHETISVSPQTVANHLAHGDVLGPCPDCFCSMDEIEDASTSDAVTHDHLAFDGIEWKPQDALHLEGTDSPSLFGHTLEVIGRAIFGSLLNSASGTNSMATGRCSSASGAQSTAMGSRTSTSTDNSVVVGRCNDATAGALFSVGNGTEQGTDCACQTNSNAFEVQVNGDTRVGGALTVDGNLVAGDTIYDGSMSGSMTVDTDFELTGTLIMNGPMVATQNAEVQGNTTLLGTLDVGSPASFAADVTILGDLDVQGSCGSCGAHVGRTFVTVSSPLAVIPFGGVGTATAACPPLQRVDTWSCSISGATAGDVLVLSASGVQALGVSSICTYQNLAVAPTFAAVIVTADAFCELGPG